jgi:hypothetical protein
VYRSCQRATFVADEGVLDEPSVELSEHLCSEQQTVYGLVDGLMLLTDRGWQEVKVGRVLEAHPAVEGQASTTHVQQADLKQLKWDLSASKYVANSGNYEEFTQKFEQLLPPNSLCKKVFISEGAI